MGPRMERRRTRAGKGVLDLTVLGFGGAPLGNLFTAITESDADATLEAAWENGVRVYDTAPLYGFGLSEERFGRVLSHKKRGDFVLSTKIGRLLEDCRPEEVPEHNFVSTPNRKFRYDYSYDAVMRSHEESLKRLKTDRIDILLVHDVDVFTHGTKEAADVKIRELFDKGGYRALEELRDSGTVKAIGAGLNEWEVCEKLLGLGDFDCFLLAGRYTLLEQEALDSFLPLCQKRDVGIILGGPFNSGILATGPIKGAYYNYEAASPDILARVSRIDAVCIAHGVKLIEAALQFVLGHPAVKTVIPGANSAAQVENNVRRLHAKIPPALWSDLKSQGLLRHDAPVPEKVFA
jgi:D-threo-aldose 1-dehydrogenase